MKKSEKRNERGPNSRPVLTLARSLLFGFFW